MKKNPLKDTIWGKLRSSEEATYPAVGSESVEASNALINEKLELDLELLLSEYPKMYDVGEVRTLSFTGAPFVCKGKYSV